MTRTGSCLCGAVRFAAKGPVRPVVYCHCTQCRKQSGHYYAASNVPDAGLSIEGEDAVTWYAASDTAKRGFCKVCGSVLFWKANDSPVTSVMAGSFDTPAGLTPGCHIFTADKGDYYAIDDGLPQHKGAWDGSLT